jgi:RNA polymerase sigma factor (sigma-70 family)
MKTVLEMVRMNEIDLNDPVTFGKLYEEYFPKVYNYVRYRVLDPTSADDLTARTFHKAIDCRLSYDPSRAGFGTWVFAIARNAVNDHLRARRRRKFLTLDWLHDRASETPDPEQLLIGNEEKERLLSAIAELPEKERDILALKYAAGKSNRIIADITGLGESNIGVIVHRAIAKLRGRMLVEEENHE